jgi:hypothetical protein
MWLIVLGIGYWLWIALRDLALRHGHVHGRFIGAAIALMLLLLFAWRIPVQRHVREWARLHLPSGGSLTRSGPRPSLIVVSYRLGVPGFIFTASLAGLGIDVLVAGARHHKPLGVLIGVLLVSGAVLLGLCVIYHQRAGGRTGPPRRFGRGRAGP